MTKYQLNLYNAVYTFMKVVKQAFEFEWDEGNRDKPKKHGLSQEETEEAFFDEDRVMFADWVHSATERRITLLGKTREGKILNITYTIRKNKIRVVTARPVNKKEVKLYEKST